MQQDPVASAAAPPQRSAQCAGFDLSREQLSSIRFEIKTKKAAVHNNPCWVLYHVHDDPKSADDFIHS